MSGGCCQWAQVWLVFLCRLKSTLNYHKVSHLWTISAHNTNTHFTRHWTFLVPAPGAHLRYLFSAVFEGVKSTGNFYRFLPQSLHRLSYPRELDTVCTDSLIPVNSIQFTQTLLSPSTRYSLHRLSYPRKLDTVCRDSLISVNSIQFAQILLSP